MQESSACRANRAIGPATHDFDSLTKKISVRAKRVLADLDVKDLDALLNLTRDDLMQAWSCGKKTIAEIESLQLKLRPQCKHEVSQAPRAALDFDNAPTEIFDAILGILSVRGAHVLYDLDVTCLTSYMKLDKEQLLNCRNCGRKTANEILRIQAGIKEFAFEISDNCLDFNPLKLLSAPCLRGISTDQTSNSNQKGIFADVENPALWLVEWIHELSRSKKQANAFMLRKGMMGCAPMTLDRIGERIGGLTRERVRQLDRSLGKKAATQFQQKRLRPLINAAVAFVQKTGGMVALDELTKTLLCKGKGGDQLIYATELISFFSELQVWKDASLLLQEDGIISHVDSQSLIRYLVGMVVDVAIAVADERHSDDLWSVEREHLKNALIKRAMIVPEKLHLENISDALLDAVVKNCRRRLRAHKDRIYSVGLWRIRFSSVTQMLDTVLKQIGRPAHFSEITEHARKWRPGILERNIHAALDRSKNALLWDRGTFVHKDRIVIPLSLIHDVETWLLKVLQEDVPFVSAYGAFTHFSTRCQQAAFPSEIALYTCLRQSTHPELAYPRLPFIYLKKGFTERIPVPIALENFVRDAGGPVSQKDVREFCLERIYLKDYQLYNLTQRVSNVIRTADWGYLHLDNFELDPIFVMPLIRHIQDVLTKEEHCSVDRIFHDKLVTCKSLGIDGPVMLYSVMQHFTEDFFSIRSYPSLARNHDSQEKSQLSIKRRILDFIRDFEKPCPYEVLEERFVEKLGYKEQQVYSVSHDGNICIYHPGCVIHKQTLEWDESKQQELERLALKIYQSAARAGRYFGRISNLLESSTMPKLPSGLYWSHTMIADLLAKGKRFLIFGNSREAFLPRDNEHGIQSFEALIGTLLVRYWNGSANLAAFENSLVKDGVIKKSLTPVMLGTGQIVAIKDREIILKELIVDA